MTQRNGTTHVVHRDLPCKLTDKEKADLSDEMARAELRIEQLKDEAQVLNAQKRKLEGHRNKLAHSVEEGVHESSVQCRWEEDAKHGCKRLFRVDTNELVEEVALTAEELNEDLFGDGDGDGDGVTPIGGGKGKGKGGKGGKGKGAPAP